MGKVLKVFIICLGLGFFGFMLQVLYKNEITIYQTLAIGKETFHFAESFHPREWKWVNVQSDLYDTSTPLPTVNSAYTIRYFTEMKFGPLFIFGAVGGNSSDTKIWDHFRIYGLLDNSMYGKSTLSCCLMFKQNSGSAPVIKKVASIMKRNFIVRSAMWNFYVACPNRDFRSGLIPEGVAVTLENLTCTESHVTYVKPYLPMNEPNKMALGTKTAFGNVSAEQIIEWMEAYKYLGVDKVVSYFIRTLNEDARKVLTYYASTGFLELYFYEPANEGRYPRIDDFKKKISQRWNDQATVVDDSFERMSGYRYFGIIDHDEFFIPSKNKTLKRLLRELEKEYFNAAGFVLKSQYYFLSWGKYTNDSNMPLLGSYTRREDTKPRQDNNKNFYIPARVALGGEDTHVIHALKGYKMIHLDAKYGYVRHFRKCRPEPEKNRKCMNVTKRIVDYEVANWSLAFKDNVKQVRRTVLGI